jgi:hypothetical protein
MSGAYPSRTVSRVNGHIPESHVVPAPSVSPPPLPSDLARAAVGANQQTKPWWRKWWALAIAAMVALFVAVGIASGGADESSVASDQAETSDGVDADRVDRGDDGGAEGVAASEAGAGEGDTPDSIQAGNNAQSPPATDPRLGTLEDPLGYDALVPVAFSAFGDADGSVWNVQIAQPRDITDLVLAANDFNDPPPEGQTPSTGPSAAASRRTPSTVLPRSSPGARCPAPSVSRCQSQTLQIPAPASRWTSPATG